MLGLVLAWPSREMPVSHDRRLLQTPCMLTKNFENELQFTSTAVSESSLVETVQLPSSTSSLSMPASFHLESNSPIRSRYSLRITTAVIAITNYFSSNPLFTLDWLPQMLKPWGEHFLQLWSSNTLLTSAVCLNFCITCNYLFKGQKKVGIHISTVSLYLALTKSCKP